MTAQLLAPVLVEVSASDPRMVHDCFSALRSPALLASAPRSSANRRSTGSPIDDKLVQERPLFETVDRADSLDDALVSGHLRVLDLDLVVLDELFIHTFANGRQLVLERRLLALDSATNQACRMACGGHAMPTHS